MKYLFISLVFFVFIAVTPVTAFAAQASFFGPIVPEMCKACPCGFGGVMQLIQNVMNIMISLSIIVATIIIAWGGALYIFSSANPESRSTANKMLINAAIGIMIVLSAWLIVDFVMKTLYGGQFGPWNTILTGTGDDCIQKRDTQPLADTIRPVTGGGGGGGGGGTPGSMTHAQAAAILQAAGIGVSSSGNCSDKSNPRCTSLDGMHEATVRQAVAVKENCNCTVHVTGGTETGHSSGHTNGYKIDISLSNEVNTFLQGLRSGGSRSNGDPIYIDKCGNSYTRESDHWDIEVRNGVCSPLR
ncbi:pilin [Patescibacteria group bacterium]|nr:pilin [Patescibacteria group bacterium]MBU1500811.1 pilin [Patescibacteria group bacterium]